MQISAATLNHMGCFILFSSGLSSPNTDRVTAYNVHIFLSWVYLSDVQAV